MTKISLTTLITLSLLINLSCDNPKPASPEARERFESVIPRPVSAEMSGNSFTLTPDTRIIVGDTKLHGAADFLAETLITATGYDISVSGSGETAEAGSISLALAEDAELGPEGYVLSVEEDGVKITANSPVGIYWGVQTFRQLLPERIEANEAVTDVEWEVATGTIRDYPQYAWRGAMLDVARHFFWCRRCEALHRSYQPLQNEYTAPPSQRRPGMADRN